MKGHDRRFYSNCREEQSPDYLAHQVCISAKSVDEDVVVRILRVRCSRPRSLGFDCSSTKRSLLHSALKLPQRAGAGIYAAIYV